MLHYIYFFIFVIEVINAIIIRDENEFKSKLSNNESTVTLNINSEIDITEKIDIPSSFQKLSFIGNSLDSSILNLKKPLYFDSNIKEIEINDININGILIFKNNKIITFNTVNLNGYIDSYFDKDTNENIKLTNLTYKPIAESVENCINLSGNIKIFNSYFYGNSSCQNRLLHYNGLENYRFELEESYLNGEYKCSLLSIENALKASIKSSHFEKGYSSRNIRGGAGIIATESTLVVKNCIFNDILSYNNGGAFNLNNNKQVEGSDLNFNNVTSLGLGSIFHISSDTFSRSKFKNIIQKNTGNVNNMRGGGLFMNIENQAEVHVDLYYAENLVNERTSGSVFFISDFSKLIVSNLYLKNLIGSGEDDGLFYTSYEPLDVEFIAKNITLENLYQLNKFDSSIIYIETNSKAIIENIKILNSGGFKTSLLNQQDNSEVEISKLEVDNFYSDTAKELINYHSRTLKETPVTLINNFKITNILSPGVIFNIRNGLVNYENGEIRNIHVCIKYGNCTTISNDDEGIEKSLLVKSYGRRPVINLKNINIDNAYGDLGIYIYVTNITITNCTVTNSHFKSGFIYLNEFEMNSGLFHISNSKFINNTSEYGTIFSIFSINQDTGSIFDVKNCEFTNNTSSNFGGVIYSVGKYINNHMNFTDCQFNNNHARLGDTIYSYSIDGIPNISNDTYFNENDLATLPTYFKSYSNLTNSISILSGESIPEDISYQLFDDYGKQIFFPKKTSDLKFKELVFFKVEINDPSNAIILGQTQDYCWDDRCTFPSVKVIGNPGIYTLSLKLKSFGQYFKFIQDSIDLEIEIRECNTKTHINPIYGNTNLKICYTIKCEPPCAHGSCDSNNYCNCDGTNFKGNLCDENIKLEREYSVNLIVLVISCLIIIGTLVLIGMTIYYRNHSIIKGGGYEFLIIILVGLIINSVNTKLLTFDKTKELCYQIYLLENTGFSLVFGSIFVKTYRIYRIFFVETRLKETFRKDIMYLIIILMTLFHWLMALVWLLSNRITTIDDYTADYKIFKRCHYPISKNLSVIFNFVILLYEFALSYAIRKVKKRFRENLIVPAYVYILYVILINLINGQNEIDVVTQDYFNIVGTTICSLAIIYIIFIKKFIEILKEKPKPKNSMPYLKMYKIRDGNMNNLNFETVIEDSKSSYE